MGIYIHPAVSGYVHTRLLGPQLGNLNSNEVSLPLFPSAWLWAFGCSQLTGKEPQGAGYIFPYTLADWALYKSKEKQQSNTLQDTRDLSSLFH